MSWNGAVVSALYPRFFVKRSKETELKVQRPDWRGLAFVLSRLRAKEKARKRDTVLLCLVRRGPIVSARRG